MIKRFVDLLALWSGIACLALVAVIAYGALMRRSGMPAAWTIEISRYLIISIAFTGIAWTAQKNAHVAVDILGSLRRRKAVARSLDWIAGLASVVFAVIMTTEGLRTVIHYWVSQTSSDSELNVPMFLPQLFIPLGAVGLVLVYLSRLAAFLPRKEKGGPVT